MTRRSSAQEVRNVDELSSGEAQVLTLGLDLLTMAAIWDVDGLTRRVVLIDEPDAHLHPDLQARFADFTVQVARALSLQVVVATHSTTFLAALGQFAKGDGGVVYLDGSSADFTAREIGAVERELTACLGGHVVMGPLFGVPILLVEGDDDYRIWSQVPRHGIVKCAVIPCNGDEILSHQRVLERLLGSLRSSGGGPAGYALRDGDKVLPVANADCPQQQIKFIGLACREAENLFLADETLALLGTSWEAAAEQIVRESGSFGEKKAQLERATTWDRRNENLKHVVGEVSRILDGKNVHWTARVGTAIGRQKPTGQLAEFLGAAAISALWPSE
jgi:energy-coupling factor transporter ATP-binding protein EcfA2